MRKGKPLEYCKYCLAFVKNVTVHEPVCWKNPYIKLHSFKSLGKRFVVRERATVTAPEVSYVTVYTPYGNFPLLIDDAFYLLSQGKIKRVSIKTFRVSEVQFTTELVAQFQKAMDAGIRV